jgi:membrane dipeptidase
MLSLLPEFKGSLTLYKIAELYQRGWSKLELAGLTGGNFLRVFEGAEKVAQDLQDAGTLPKYDVYDKREDLPVRKEL